MFPAVSFQKNSYGAYLIYSIIINIYSFAHSSITTTTMTRTHKWSHSEEKYFTHNGNFNEAPNKVKKNGAGKGNWGTEQDELNELIDSGEAPELLNKGGSRRGSNSMVREMRFQKVNDSAREVFEDED
ncbi:Tma10 protein [Saccharomycopsis crataegensis]|uniref:Tma10 protein n=1 Tax=Saccharomycopsis crataegensis TaxID=43959 RepID=A0AAV5QIG6_9ASCO|nr:Tma10 protein [Saccharomycopsis crataegensis]